MKAQMKQKPPMDPYRRPGRAVIMRALPLLMLLGACTVQPVSLPDEALPDYYASIQADLMSRGLMRTETSPADAPFTVNDLVANFIEVALFDEFGLSGNRFVPRRQSSTLRRWEGPVRVGVVIGPSVSPSQARRDVENVRRFTRKLARISGVDMRVISDGIGNFTVMFLNRAEQRDFGMFLKEERLAPPAVANSFQNSPPEAFCVAYTFASEANEDVYGAALILVKAEHRDLMRLSCIHEEMAQAMGLPNDSFDARPSIFNDDEEFALMTKHDEILMRMLYDRRLKPGMTEAEARPLLPQIARDAARAAGVSLGSS